MGTKLYGLVGVRRPFDNRPFWKCTTIGRNEKVFNPLDALTLMLEWTNTHTMPCLVI